MIINSFYAMHYTTLVKHNGKKYFLWEYADIQHFSHILLLILYFNRWIIVANHKF